MMRLQALKRLLGVQHGRVNSLPFRLLLTATVVKHPLLRTATGRPLLETCAVGDLHPLQLTISRTCKG